MTDLLERYLCPGCGRLYEWEPAEWDALPPQRPHALHWDDPAPESDTEGALPGWTVVCRCGYEDDGSETQPPTVRTQAPELAAEIERLRAVSARAARGTALVECLAADGTTHRRARAVADWLEAWLLEHKETP